MHCSTIYNSLLFFVHFVTLSSHFRDQPQRPNEALLKAAKIGDLKTVNNFLCLKVYC